MASLVILIFMVMLRFLLFIITVVLFKKDMHGFVIKITSVA